MLEKASIDEAFIDFEELRHPALCAGSSLKGDFIPNDVKLGGDVGRIALLTGEYGRSPGKDAELTVCASRAEHGVSIANRRAFIGVY